MSDEHEHHHHSHEHEHEPLAADDAGSQALAEALRSSFAIVKIVMVLLVALFFFRGLFTVGPQEKAVILRFGKPVGEGQKALLNPGLHWSFPYPIDEVVRIPITEIQHVSSTVGWYATTPEQELSGEEIPAGPSLTPGVDGYAITADNNIIHTRATLYYRIEDPIHYVFDFVNASNAVQNALNNAILYTAAHFNVDDAIYSNQSGFQDAVRERVEDLIEKEQLGVTVDQVQAESIPPRQLKSIFDQVTTARENRGKLLNDAHSYENQVTNAAAGQAATIIAQAQSGRARYVELLTADAKRFSNLLPKYESNPSLFEQQALIAAMGGILTNVQDKIYLPQRADGKPRELRLLLNREPPAPNGAAQSP
ncbi:MAG TPA: protease modulator HflK [Verrucomicrobiae bacterium]|nr:protease modulator HflK [Verrucomicrobiae bacterium]